MRYFLIGLLAYLAIVLTIGVYCVDYCIWAVTGQDLRILADLLLAAFFGSFFIPAALLLWVAGMLGIVYPLIN